VGFQQVAPDDPKSRVSVEWEKLEDGMICFNLDGTQVLVLGDSSTGDSDVDWEMENQFNPPAGI
jgi:hypothetical protein